MKIDPAGKPIGPIAEHFAGEIERDLISTLKLRPGDVAIFASAKAGRAAQAALAAARVELGKTLELYDKAKLDLVWVNEFPFYDFDPVALGWTGLRHPFTQPLPEDATKIPSEKHSVRTKGYDLVLNGVELGAGSIRNHDLALQQRIFEMFEYSQAEVEKRFGFVLEAFRFGVPPHGGIALGLDRMLAVLQGVEAVDEVIAFPKDRDGSDPMVKAPTPIDKDLLRALLGG
jgi:aspartyl-tRNA synthetase